MKTFLLLSVSSVATAGALPSLPAKIILSAFVLMAVLTQAARRAPVGYQDEDGFHSVTRQGRGAGAAVKTALAASNRKQEPKNNLKFLLDE